MGEVRKINTELREHARTLLKYNGEDFRSTADLLCDASDEIDRLRTSVGVLADRLSVEGRAAVELAELHRADLLPKKHAEPGETVTLGDGYRYKMGADNKAYKLPD